MRKRPEPFGPQLTPSDLLVVGYRGTLRPQEELSQAVALPPEMETLLAPWLAAAPAQLKRRISREALYFRGEPILLAPLLLLLKDRLASLLTQAIAIAQPQNLPVLRHLLRTTSAEWTSATALFLQRLQTDHAALAVAHGLPQLPQLESVSGTASDAHAGGHSVLRVAFAGGLCLYYKPRPVTGEWLWHALLEAIARLDPTLPLPAARIHTRQSQFNYGWAESLVGTEDHPSKDYWHRAGAMLCIAQHARLTDLHLGNVLATSHGPAVTDAECLATPDTSPAPSLTGSSQQKLFAEAQNSILATGLLATGNAASRPDISGLFGRSGPVKGLSLPRWDLSTHGAYRLSPAAAALVPHPNAPVQTSALAVLPQLTEGYRHAAEILMRARSSLTATGAIWRVVLEQQHAPRVIVRDTLAYAMLMSRSLAPAYLRSAPKRQRALLSTLFVDAPPSISTALLRAEASALFAVHMPRFVVLPESRTLAASSGRAIAHRFATQTPAHGVLKDIEALSPRRLNDLLLPALLISCL